MNIEPALDSLLQSIGRLLGLPDLAWDEQHSCTLSFGDDVHLTLYPDEEQADLTMYTLVGELPAQAPLAVWSELMAANLFGKGTGGATLGYEPDSQWVYLSRRLPAEGLTAQRWLGEMKAFVGACRQWQSRWSQLLAQAGKGSDSGGAPQGDGSFVNSAATPADFREGIRADMLRA